MILRSNLKKASGTIIFLKSLLKPEFSFVRGSLTMHFICMCDRTLWLVVLLSFMKPTFCSSGSSLCSSTPRRLIFFCFHHLEDRWWQKLATDRRGGILYDGWTEFFLGMLSEWSSSGWFKQNWMEEIGSTESCCFEKEGWKCGSWKWFGFFFSLTPEG